MYFRPQSICHLHRWSRALGIPRCGRDVMADGRDVKGESLGVGNLSLHQSSRVLQVSSSPKEPRLKRDRPLNQPH